jgi:hypothetical protein
MYAYTLTCENNNIYMNRKIVMNVIPHHVSNDPKSVFNTRDLGGINQWFVL